jgi:hypothetical protein
MFCNHIYKKGNLLRYLKTQYILFLFLFIGLASSQDVVINELQPLNTNTISDEDGEFADWIEIYNPGSIPVNMDGMGISDDADQLNKWIFPAVTLDPNEFLLIFASGKDRKTRVTHWETVINKGDSWRYRSGTSEPPSTWRQTNFDDNAWSEGPSGFGYGDGDDTTILPVVLSVAVRKKFNVSNPDGIISLLFHIDYDDAFVAYLNDTEVARKNIGTPGIVPPFNQGANNWREAEIYQGGYPEEYDISGFAGLLQPGENVLAIQVHNYDLNSSDMSCIPFLTMGLQSPPDNPRGLSDHIVLSLPNLHTNFRLSAGGETLYLTNPDSQVTDTIAFSEMPTDLSLGRQPDGTNDWRIFDQPSPGGANTSTGYMGLTPDPIFSLSTGVYSGPQAFSISYSGNIYYTLDGTEPDETATLYTDPMLISKTTVIRARAFEAGKMPSSIITSTYLIDEDLHLPVMSLTTDPENLWDEQTGIYVKGPNAETVFPYFGSNFWQDWERPIHVEFIEQDGSFGFKTDAGVKITGGWSRGNDQKSLAIFMRRRYGQAELNYQLFPDVDISKFKAFVIRNSGNDWGNTMMRDGMITSLTNPLGLEKQAFRPVVLFLNGEYWGIQNLRDKMNEDYLASHYDLDPDEIDLLENNAMAIEGSPEHYNMMRDFITNNNIKDPAVYENVTNLIDVTNFIDYQVSQIYCDNNDWPGNNIKFWRPQTSDGIWRWILFDADFGFDIWSQNRVNFNTLEFATDPNGPDWPNPPWSTYLLRRLLENDSFKINFINRFADHLNTIFSSTHVNQHVDSLKAIIRDDISRHLSRWGGTYETWEYLVTNLKVFATQRPAYVRSHIIQKFNLSGDILVNVENLNIHGGQLKLNSININTKKWSGRYFSDIPILIQAIPYAGYRFAGWAGGSTSLDDSIQINLNSSETFYANFLPDTSLVINEINYNSSPDFPAGDWIEFYNSSMLPIDVSGWIFKDSDDAHIFTFPDSLIVAPDSYIILSGDSLKFSTSFPSLPNPVGYFDFGLNNGGELVRLFDSENHLVDSLTYMDVLPWPVEADGFGPTLSLREPYLDNSLPDSWEASVVNGTPGEPNMGLTGFGTDLQNSIPNHYELEQNYPNPFNPQTTIQVSLPESGHLNLIIFDVRGKIVETISDGYFSAGIHKFMWKPKSSVASGIYFYQLEIAGKFLQTKKLLFLK